MMVTRGDLTKTSVVGSAEFAAWSKVGKVCILRLSFTAPSNITDSTATLFTGAPKAMGATRTTLRRVNARNTDYARVGVTVNGTVVNQYTNGGITAGQYEGELVYITAD